MKEDMEKLLKHFKRLEERYLYLKEEGLSYNDEYYAHILLTYITRLESNWNELKKWLEYEIYSVEPKRTLNNYNCEYDSEEDYIRAMKKRSKLITLKRILIQMQELEGKDEN